MRGCARFSRRLPLLWLLAMVVLAGGLLLWAARPGPPSLNDRVRSVATQLRCPVCQGESIYDSPASLAAAMRHTIRDRLRSGQSESQIEAYFVSRYGAWILLTPPASGIGLLAWLLPPLLLLVGLLVVGMAVMTWRTRAPTEPWSAPAAAEDMDYALELAETRRESGEMPDDEFRWVQDRLLLPNSPEIAAPAPKRSTGRTPQIVAMITAAVAIAASVSLAVQARGASPMTGTIPGPTPSAPSPRQGVIDAAYRAVGFHPRSPAAWSSLGEVELLFGRIDQAARAYRHAMLLDPGGARPRFGLAYIEIGKRHPAAGLSLLRPLLATQAGNSQLWMLEGLGNRALRRRPRAVFDFKRFLRLSPKGALAASARRWIGQLQGPQARWP